MALVVNDECSLCEAEDHRDDLVPEVQVLAVSAEDRSVEEDEVVADRDDEKGEKDEKDKIFITL